MEITKREVFESFQELVKAVEERKVVIICSWGIEEKCNKQEKAESLGQATDRLCKEHYKIKKEAMEKLNF